jgi:hypothetical protein
MLLTILVYTGLVLFVLLALYLLCRRFPVLGDGLGFLCTLQARLLVKLQWFLEAAAVTFLRFAEGSLLYPPDVTDDAWYGVYVIARIILFVVCSIILIGDVYNTLQSIPILFGGVGAVDLPGSLAIPSAFLFVAMGALYGVVGLECATITPYGTHLFPTLTDKVKKWLGGSCLTGFVLSVLFAVAFWAFRGYFLLSPDDAGVWAIPILALAGLLLSGASVLALWGLLVGLTGVFTVVFWLLYCGCTVLAGGLSLIPSLFDVVTLHLTQGERTVYERYVHGAPYQVPNTWFHKRSSLSHDGKDQNVSSASVQEDQPSTSGFPISSHKENEVQPMNDGFVGITLNGVLGSQLLRFVQVSFANYKQLVRCSGRVNVHSPMSPIDLGVDVSAATYDLMGNKLVEAFLGAADVPFIMHGLDAANGLSAVQMLRDIKRRLPKCTQVVITAVTPSDLLDASVQEFFKELKTLHTEDVVATTLIFKTNSELVRSQGELKVYHYVARFLADLVAASMQSSNNLSALAVCNQLHHVSPFMSFAFATAPVASGTTKKRWFWLRWLSDKAVVGSLEEMLHQALAVTKDVLEKDDTRAFDQPVVLSKLCFLLHDAPLSLADRRFHQFEERNNQQVKQLFPNATIITISGQPVSPLLPSSSPFRIGCVCLYPVSMPVAEKPQLVKNDDAVKEDTHAPSTALPVDTIVFDAPAVDASVVNGKKNGRGRPVVKKEQ